MSKPACFLLLVFVDVVAPDHPAVPVPVPPLGPLPFAAVFLDVVAPDHSAVRVAVPPLAPRPFAAVFLVESAVATAEVVLLDELILAAVLAVVRSPDFEMM